MYDDIAFSVAAREPTSCWWMRCFEHIHALKEKGTTVVLFTQDTESVCEFCDRAILLDGWHDSGS